MVKILILVVLLLFISLGYLMHKLIRRFINPRQSVSHMFLFFLAHFVGIFILSFIINLLVLRFSGFLIRP
ncbi:MAG: hypothetical protein EOO03_06130 [Chitinophagaceae bacterium]|nr:MAG: hypothetical protein EOO03_06130 [Chitinophagaceae bacterium]